MSTRKGRCTAPKQISEHQRSDWSPEDESVCCAKVHPIALKTHGGVKRPLRKADTGSVPVDTQTRTSQAVDPL